MYLQELSLKNIKGFHEAHLRFPEPKHTGNWHVILGDNGTGKTTILQAIALSLVDAQDLLEHPQDWVRKDNHEGQCAAAFLRTGAEAGAVKTAFSVLCPVGSEDLLASKDHYFRRQTPAAVSAGLRRNGVDRPFLIAGYGALRRMESGSARRSRRPTLEDTVRSLFDAAHELTDLEDWLMRLDYLAKDFTRPENQREVHGSRLDTIRRIVASLLPRGPFIEFECVNSEGAVFIGPQGEDLRLKDLSEGYRAVFAMAVDLMFLGHLFASDDDLFAFDQAGSPFVNLEGIVLIDEVDAHLHPKWQQQIGPFLQRAFPRVQFIVSTHSPFVAQAATEGGLFVLNWAHEGVAVEQPAPAVQTWAAEEILESPVFGLETTRRPEVENALNEYTRLQAQAQIRTLSSEEKKLLQALKRKLKPVLPPPGNAEDTLREIERRIREVRKQP